MTLQLGVSQTEPDGLIFPRTGELLEVWPAQGCAGPRFCVSLELSKDQKSQPSRHRRTKPSSSTQRRILATVLQRRPLAGDSVRCSSL